MGLPMVTLVLYANDIARTRYCSPNDTQNLASKQTMKKVEVLVHTCRNINELDIDGSVYSAGAPGLANYVYNDFALNFPAREQLIVDMDLLACLTLHSTVQYNLDYLTVRLTVMMTPQQLVRWEKLCFMERLSN